MYNKKSPTRTTLNVNQQYEGETIENKIRRIVNNKEPISDGAPLVYTERKEGVKPEYDIRTDRWEVAVDAMDKVTASTLAKREAKMKVVKDEPEAPKGDQKADGAAGVGEA